MNRRHYLSLLSVAGVGALAGCPSSSDEPGETEESPPEDAPGITSTPTAEERTYETVVNLGEEGADPSGEESIEPLLTEHEGDDTKLVLPEGRYKAERHVFADLDTFALVGKDATLVPTHRGPGFLFSFRRVSNLNVEGLEIDQTENGVFGSFSVRCVDGSNLVRDITLNGYVDRPERIHGLTVFCEGPQTSLTFADIDMTDGARNGTGVYVFPQDDFSDPSRKPGALLFRDCRLHGWGGEGIYGSPHAGPISIIGGHYKNNAIQQVRVGGGNDNQAVVKDVEVVVDDPPSYADGNMRGIWLEEGEGCLVDSCTVALRDVGNGGSNGGIVVGSEFGEARITNTSVRTDVNVPAINISYPATEYHPGSMPSLDRLPESWAVSLTDIEIRGESDSGAAIHLYGRENCTLENVSVDQPNGTRHGLLTGEALSTSIRGGSWVTNGYPMLLGPTDESTDSTEIACFESLSELSSTQFDGSTLDANQRSGGGERMCIPTSAVPSQELNSRIPYLGITGTEEGVLRGHPVLAKWDGSELIRR